MKKRISILILALFVAITNFMPLNLQAKNNDIDAFNLIDMIINAEVDYGLSGAQLVVIHKGEIVKKDSYGYTNSYKNIVENGETVLDDVEVINREDRNKVTNETLFDLASNTKMYAGNYAIQYLVSRGELSLEDKIVDFFPEFTYKGIGVDQQSEMTIGHLLRHDSGFIASPKYHDNTFTGNLGNEDNPENWLYTQNEDEILEKLLLTPIEYNLDTKVRYSDVDFMLIGKIVEEVSGMAFDKFVLEKIYKPLGLNRITFNPLDNGFSAEETSSSELHGNTRDGRVFFNNYRTDVITGEVHDEKAYYSFAGVAGHAGLFGSASDIANLAQIMLTEGKANGYEVFTQETIDTIIQPSPLNDTYAYGWRRQGANKDYAWAFSKYASPQTIGHTGWTGTITQIDPENEIVIALFTNARNSPIMGPERNDFYTKGFNTNDYGTITTLVYEGLGFNEAFDSTQYVIDKIESTNITSASHKNSVRALYTVLKQLAISDDKAKQYVLDNLFEANLNEDFDTETLHLDINHLLNVDKSMLEDLLNKFDGANKFSRSNSDILNYAKLILNDLTATQEVVDAAYADLKSLVEDEKPEEIDLTNILYILGRIEELDETLYSQETYNPLKDLTNEVVEYLKGDTLIQKHVDNYYTKLANLYENLKYKEVIDRC